MALTVGDRLGHYDVTALIGEGGMGRVYRATDTQLHRDVALKILPDAFAADPDRLARFQREAQVLASLNHPGIAAIYGIEEDEVEGRRALVLELVEGPTLADRIGKGPIPLDEALPIAKQIAEALEAAHEAGVIHRDLKPANIKVREDGTVKVLDFGLAKALDPSPDADPSQSPTLTAAATQMGVIMGTAAYMSPEQARGKPVDKRADIWAYGAVLFEMLTGKKLFEASDASEMLASVLVKDPDVSSIGVHVPAHIRAVVRRCLIKDSKDRLRDIGDVRLAMDGAFAAAEPAGLQASVDSPRWRQVLPIAVTTLVAGLLGAGFVSWLSPTPPVGEASVVRFPVIVPTSVIFSGINDRMVAVSPEGARVAYAANRQLYIRTLDSNETRLVDGTEDLDPTSLVFSPDGQWVAFHTRRYGQLQKVSIGGGAPVTVADIDSPFGVSWGPADEIVFAEARRGVFRVPGGGGTPELLIPAEAEGNRRFHGPQLLPGGRAVLVTVASSSWDRGEVVVELLESGERRLLIERGTDARYLPTGHLVYLRAGTLLAVPFDLDSLEVTGSPVPVVDSIERARLSGGAHFDISRTGVLVYDPGGGNVERRLVWRDRTGRIDPIEAPPLNYVQARISPDGTTAVLEVLDQQSDLWVWDFGRETMTRLIGDPSNDGNPEWSPDGQHVVFSSDRNDTFGVYRITADGAGAVETLFEHPRLLGLNAFTPDGTRLVLTENLGVGPPEFSVLILDGEPRLAPLFHPGYLLDDAHFSPNGRWLVYESGASGATDIFVRPFPDLEAGREPISTDHGHSPMWGPGGREIFFFERGTSNRLMRVEVTTEPTFSASSPELMFAVNEIVDGRDREYDIHPDGERFLMISAQEGTRSTESLPGLQRIEIVLNWFQELTERAPVN